MKPESTEYSYAKHIEMNAIGHGKWNFKSQKLDYDLGLKETNVH